MAIQVGDVLRVAARMQFAGADDIVNVYHLQVAGNAPSGDAAVIDGVGDFLETCYYEIQNNLPNLQTYEDINIFNVTQGVPVAVTAWPTFTTGGESTNHAQPGQISAMVRFTTGYSRNWARKFLGRFTEAANTASGYIENALMTNLANYATKVLTPYVYETGNTLITVVYNKALLSWVTCQEAVIRNIWSTVRTRRNNRGS